MAKSASVGTKFKLNSKVVGGLQSIGGIDINADNIEVTDLANEDGYKEFVASFKDAGEVTLSGFLDGADEGQTEAMTLLNSGEVTDFAIEFPKAIGKNWTGKGVVTQFATSVDVNDAIKFDCKLKVTGKPTLATVTG